MSEPQLRLLRTGRDGARSVLSAERAPYRSRSYRDPWALVAWHERRVGVDIERIGPSDVMFARSICTPDELQRFGAQLSDGLFSAALWSSKEALAKALGDAVDYDPRRLPSPLTWPELRAGAWQARRLFPPDVPAEHVGWLVWRL